MCKLDGCDRPALARSLCSVDYQRIKAQGRLDEVSPKAHGPCEHCGGIIPQQRRYGAKFCSVECKDAEMDARKHELVMARRASRRTTCAWCETAITQKRADQRFCSRDCADGWRNEQTRLAMLRAKKAIVRNCEVCGDAIPSSRARSAIYCSPECKRLAQGTNPRSRHTTVEYNRRYLYGITPEQFDRMLTDQHGCCAICRTDTPNGKGGWHVDHDHATDKVRGLLCHNCNLALGNFKDDVARLRAAIAYLEAHAT